MIFFPSFLGIHVKITGSVAIYLKMDVISICDSACCSALPSHHTPMSPCQWEFIWFFLGEFPPHGTAGETVRPLYSRKVRVRARAIKCSALCPCSIPWRRSFDDYISSQILGDARRIDRQLGNHVRDLGLLVSNWCLLFRKICRFADLRSACMFLF